MAPTTESLTLALNGRTLGATGADIDIRTLAPYSVLVCKEMNNLRGGMQNNGQKNEEEKKNLLATTTTNNLDNSQHDISQEGTINTAKLDTSTMPLISMGLKQKNSVTN